MRQGNLQQQLESSIDAHHHEICYCLSKNLEVDAAIAESKFYNDCFLLREIIKERVSNLERLFNSLAVLGIIILVVGGIITL